METKEKILYNVQHLRQLVFEVTNKCNLKCCYCALSNQYNNKNDGKGEILSFEKARTLLDYLFSLRKYNPKAKNPLIITFYGGEPLINMKLIKQIISYIEKSDYPNVVYGMTTNAMLLDKYLDFIVEKKFQLVISLDGNEFNHSYRTTVSGHNSFKQVFKNTALLHKKFPKYFKDFVQFNSVLHNRNSAEEIFNFIKKEFNKIPMISTLNTTGINQKKMDDFNAMYKNINKSVKDSKNCDILESELFIQAPRILNLAYYIFKNSGNVFASFNDLKFGLSSQEMKHTGTCSPFAKEMFVRANGKILQCEKISHEFVLGQINDSGVELNFDEIAIKQNALVSKLSQQCNECYIKKNCQLCIYTLDDILSNNPKCNDYSTKEDFEQYERITLEYLKKHPEYYEKILSEITGKF